MTEWTILGAGALGCVMAGLLRRQGEPVSLLLSERHRGHLHPSLDLITLSGRHQLIHTRPCFAEQAGQIRCLLVVTKAYQVVEALQGLHKLPESTPIILLHNGLGVAAQVQALYPRNPLIAAVSSHGAMKEGDWLVRHTGKGETWLGPINAAAAGHAGLVSPLAAALGHAQWSEDILRLQHQKLAINAVINPLTACHNIRNGQLLEPRFADVLEQLSEEVHQVMLKLGGQEQLDDFRRRLHKVIELTATNYSSMHQDLAHGRRTEIDYITGYVINNANELPVPVCRQLYREIQRRSGKPPRRRTSNG
ncbi:ketopantoate reductase family protein [Zobellella iuensis]|uniref:2-dehydropantoate 2-reductase n=1 Tax=Zobellella iuensis TaxID=2803811 RepID=A0ABS1QV93_9GAMM|nr:2-dehydropantoate 2-reductase [Zobellella iuensis]MBL1378788.1 2-dehydropantoate 2-reductase [Zobellella iuensis]